MVRLGPVLLCLSSAFALTTLPLCAHAQQAAFTSGMTWDWQLSEPFNLGVGVQVLDLDPDSLGAGDIAELRAKGVLTICYVSVGTLEEWRGDVAAFPAQVIGKSYVEWQGERFLDIRQTDILLPLMQARFADCADKGYNAVEPDNMDVYSNESGFDISAAQTVAYVTALADIAHGMGLAIGQKNVPELTADLEPALDFIVTEGCIADSWCDQVSQYAAHDKAIFAAEYEVAPSDRMGQCGLAAAASMSLIFKELDLDARGARCS
jgi:hypothetical protein